MNIGGIINRVCFVLCAMGLGASLATGAGEEVIPDASVAAREAMSADTPKLLSTPGLSRGVDAIVAQIRKREVDLTVREQMLAERERAVAELEAGLEQRATELDRIREDVEDRIAEWSAQGSDRIGQLAGVYASMPSKKAGALLGKLDLDLTVSVIRGMKKKNSAGVLAAMRPDRALEVSRRLLKPLDPRTDAPAARRK